MQIALDHDARWYLFGVALALSVAGCVGDCGSRFWYLDGNVVRGPGAYDEATFVFDEPEAAPATDECLEVLNQSYGYGSDRPATTTIPVYDSRGRRVAESTWATSTGVGKPDRVTLYSYDERGNRVRRESYSEGAWWRVGPLGRADPEEEAPVTVVTHKYEGDRRVRTTEYDGGPEQPPTNVTTYEYDDHARLVYEESEHRLRDKVWKTAYEYDGD